MAACIAVGAFIVENAGIISSIAIVGAVTSFLTADTPQQELVNNPQASQDLFTNDLLLAGGWLTAGQFTLDVGAYYAEKGQQPTANNPVSSKPKAPYASVENSPSAAPDFVVTANGEVIIVPENAVGPYAADNGLGFKYENGSGGHGLNPSVTGVRIMDPTVKTQSSPGYPGGYVSYYNQQTTVSESGAIINSYQTLNPYTGQTITRSNPMWHIPLKAQ